MEAILDTNFIISCVKKRIDYLDALESMGFTPVIPREVLQELKDLRFSAHGKERGAVEIALDSLPERIKKTTLGGKTTDGGLIAKGKKGLHIATLDGGIRRIVPNTIVISEATRGLVVERK